MTTMIALANREVRKMGSGFRLWETCTSRKGSPISPIFSTIEELCDWAADNATINAYTKISASEWMTAITSKKPASIRIQ